MSARAPHQFLYTFSGGQQRDRKQKRVSYRQDRSSFMFDWSPDGSDAYVYQGGSETERCASSKHKKCRAPELGLVLILFSRDYYSSSCVACMCRVVYSFGGWRCATRAVACRRRKWRSTWRPLSNRRDKRGRRLPTTLTRMQRLNTLPDLVY